MICGIMTDFCINATVEAGFEHGLHMIVLPMQILRRTMST